MANETDTGISADWGDASVNYAIAVSIGAGAATGVGGALVFFPAFFKAVPQSLVLGVSLALSAGVMMYVSFIEIFGKALGSISETEGISEGGATAITTVCFFTGMLICVLLEGIVHAIGKYTGAAGHSHECVASSLAPDASRKLDESNVRTSNGGVAAQHGDNGQSLPPSPPMETATLGKNTQADVSAQSVSVDVGEPPDLNDASEKQRLAKMGAMTALAIAIHNFPEGLATFLATVADTGVGVSLGVAIAVHNIPEGICVAMPIYYATGNRTKAFLWSLLSGITEPIGGIVGFAALQPVFTDLAFGIVFAMVGGMMVFIVCHELLPAAHRYMGNAHKTTAWLVLGMIVMATSLVIFVL